MKPGSSPTVTATLPTRSTRATRVLDDRGVGEGVRTTWTSVAVGAALAKCRPMTLLGRPVATASSVTDRLEVLVARMASGPTILSSWAKISALSARRSGTASTTSSARGEVLQRRAVPDAAERGVVGLTARRPERSIAARPRAAASSLTSTAVTDRPARANTSAMAAPAVPSPTMPTSFNSLATLPSLHRR